MQDSGTKKPTISVFRDYRPSTINALEGKTSAMIEAPATKEVKPELGLATTEQHSIRHTLQQYLRMLSRFPHKPTHVKND